MNAGLFLIALGDLRLPDTSVPERGYKNVLINHFKNMGILTYSINVFAQFFTSSINDADNEILSHSIIK